MLKVLKPENFDVATIEPSSIPGSKSLVYEDEVGSQILLSSFIAITANESVLPLQQSTSF